ncbi:subfamily B ATP-binding cassette protein MsbA [Parvibaculum indicum]|uniref:ABC transporter ATP-binding protein n=1 Tax=Parvibaculum indicum TaxID=562969 RepID=UPI00141DDE5F|nr:ABC transporter ATP-binding protein [Parvibaculum indicum]NIJ41811.1 subfamily B ATP-binding cassette protein MsbA [Parvibaculum indicum]
MVSKSEQPGGTAAQDDGLSPAMRAAAENAPAPEAALELARDINTWSVARRMLGSYLKPLWKLAAFALVLNAIVGATTGAIPWLLKTVVDDVVNNPNPPAWQIWGVPLAAAVIMCIKSLASYGSTVTMSTIGQRIVEGIQTRMFERLVRADLAWLSATHSGRFVASFMADVGRLTGTITTSMIDQARNLLSVIGLLGAVFIMNWKLALIATCILPLAALFLRRFGKKTRKAARQSLEGTGDLSTLISETLKGIRVVKAYGREDHELGRARVIVRQLVTQALIAIRMRAASGPTTEALSGIGIGLVIYVSIVQIQAGNLTLGEMTGFITALMLAYQPLKALANTQTTMQEGVAAAIRLFPILDTEPQVVSAPDAPPLAVRQGTVKFENVSFEYADGTPALHNISLDVPKGHTVALVGPSGAGKSTILNLVPRFYDPIEGRVLIDGQDLKDVTVDSVRAVSALVTQEPFLFDDTIRANIAYGRADATDEEIREAARNAAADEFISELPKGYDTLVGEAGQKLSGGQRQRIAIARAMLKDAPILLLDEATSALDTASELKVQNALARLMVGRTTLVIAHRLSTIKHADTIYVIDDGRVLEHGTHDELIMKGGLYAELSRSQFIEEPAQESQQAEAAAIAGE